MTNKEARKIIFAKSGLSREEAEKMYFRFFHNWAENHKYIYKKFSVKFSETILDVGCGAGHNLINFSASSAGIEKDEKFSTFAASLGLNIKKINIEDDLLTLRPEKFGIVWCADFLVHTASPFKFLYECRELLGEGGRIVLHIPLMSFLNRHKSSCHLYAFNKKSLVYLLEICGYKIIKTSGCVRRLPGFVNFALEPLLQIFGTNIWILAEKLPEPKFNKNKLFFPKWMHDN